MSVYVYDIEVFINCFTITFRNIETQEVKYFVIFSNKRDEINNLDELIEFLKNVRGLIGYNNLNYDYPILYFIIEGYNRFTQSNTLDITQQIYYKSQEIINAQYSAIRPNEVKIPQLDLYRIWHFDNKNKATSLKHIEIAINFPNVEDFPYEFNHIVLPQQIDDILSYNLNDVNATYEFYLITKGQTELKLFKGLDKIQLRKDIQSEYAFNCLNFNDIKIGAGITAKYYSEISGINYYDFKDLRTYRSVINLVDCIPNYIEFKTPKLQKILEEIKNTTITPDEKFKKIIIIGGTKYLLAKGGLHSDDKPRTLQNTNYQLLDCDVSSLYPSLILNEEIYPQHLGKSWLKGYLEIYNQRIEAKSKKEDKKFETIQQALKLSLNGSYGKFKEEYSWMYDPLCTFRTTIAGQLSLLMLIEELEVQSISVVSANTDGIVALVSDRLKYDNICKEWEYKTNLVLEYTEYSKLIQTSVNDYIAQKTNTKLKFKGDFEVDKDIHKDHSMRIIRIAMMRYFVFGIPIKETIENHLSRTEDYEDDTANNGIYDFCLAKRALKGFKLQTHELVDNEE